MYEVYFYLNGLNRPHLCSRESIEDIPEKIKFRHLSVYIVAYGVAIQSLIYPGITQPPFSIPWGVLFRSFFEMLGDPNFEEIGATHLENCTIGEILQFI